MTTKSSSLGRSVGAGDAGDNSVTRVGPDD